MTTRTRKTSATAVLDAPLAEETPVTDTPTAPDTLGRLAVRVTPAASKPRYYVRNLTNQGWDIPSNGANVPNLLVLAHQEKPLPDPEFWMEHERFGVLCDSDQLDAYGNPVPPVLQVFTRVKGYKQMREVPADIRVDEKYIANVQFIMSGNFEDAQESIEMDPMMGDESRVRDVTYLCDVWGRVLEHAHWQLLENRRCGFEVDQRRIDTCANRLEYIAQLRRDTGHTMARKRLV